MVSRLTTVPGDEHFAKYAIGAYGRDSWACAMTYMKRHRTFIDVGAHIGHFCWHAMGRFRHICAIEPVVLNFKCLQANVEQRWGELKRKPRVDMYLSVAGARKENAAEVWFVDPSEGKNSGAWEVRTSAQEGVTAQRRDVITIDDMKLDDVDLIKIDTQGWEGDVLDGAAETIARCKPVLIVEVVNNGNMNHELTDKIVSLGYWGKALVQKNYIAVPSIKQ